MLTSASKGVRVAAGVVCAFFTVFVLFHVLWAVGITWGLEEMFPGGQTDASLSLTAASLIGATAGAAAIVVTLGRVGWLKTPLSDRLLRIGSWVVFAWPAIGTVTPSTWAQRAVSLLLAIVALVVARAHERPHAGEAPPPPVLREPLAH